MYRVLPILTDEEVAECRRIATAAQFVDGRISNPHNTAKQNEQLHEAGPYQQSSELLRQALIRSEEFRNFSFAYALAPPMMTRYKPGMKYGLHTDAAFLPLPAGTIRSDLSCTIFLNEPADYDGGELHVRLGDADLTFKLKPGEAVVYPSDTLHEVVPITRGGRLVAITFIQSRIQDPFRRNLLYNLNEIGALEGGNMQPENFTRMQLVQNQLMRYWAETP